MKQWEKLLNEYIASNKKPDPSFRKRFDKARLKYEKKNRLSDSKKRTKPGIFQKK